MSTSDDLWPGSASLHGQVVAHPVSSRDQIIALTKGRSLDEAIDTTRKLLHSMAQSSRHEDILSVAEYGLTLCKAEIDTPARLEFLLAKGWRLLRLVVLESAALVLREADALAHKLEDRRAEAEVLRYVGMLHGLSSDFELAAKNFQRSIEMFSQIDDHFGLADALMGQAVTKYRQGHVQTAIELSPLSVQAAMTSGNWNCAIHANANWGHFLLGAGQTQAADAPLSQAERIFVERGVGPFWGWALTLSSRATFLMASGEPKRAVELYLRSIATCEQIGEVVARPIIEKLLSTALQQMGEFEDALHHLQTAYEFELSTAKRGRALEIQTLRGSLELLSEQRERKLIEEQGKRLGRMVEQRTRELQREIDIRRKAEATAHELAFHDPLTGLPNRRRLTQLLEEHIARARKSGTGVGVLFVDLDQFSLINDASGHKVGDDVLIEIAGRLRRLAIANDAVCRFGGDEFVVVVPEIDAAERSNTEKVIESIFAAFAEPFKMGATERSISVSIGIARFPEHSREASQLVRFADIAMYAAKREGRLTVAEFSESLSEAIEFRSDLERDFKRALAAGQFWMAYQPKIEVASGRVVGLEALARWDHPRYGAVPPTKFIGFLEETGWIHEFGRWAVRNVCAQIKAWREAGLPNVRVAVNVSQKQLQDDTFADFVTQSLSEAGIPAEGLEIEITESTLLTDAARVVAVLKRISESGVHISIDDFGTGYSSLSLLSKLPFDTIKIDQSFVASMLDGASERMIVQTIIRMAEALGKSVIAEGVETKAQLDALASEGCGYCQGAWYGMAERPEKISARFAHAVGSVQ